MKFATVIRQIFAKYSGEEIYELRRIFNSQLALELKAEMLQYVTNSIDRTECENFLLKYEAKMIKELTNWRWE